MKMENEHLLCRGSQGCAGGEGGSAEARNRGGGKRRAGAEKLFWGGRVTLGSAWVLLFCSSQQLLTLCCSQVLSGQFLSDRSVKTYVEVELLGLPRDAKRKHRTKLTSTANSINPVWKEEAFVFEKVRTFGSNLDRESLKLLMALSAASGEVSASRRDPLWRHQAWLWTHSGNIQTTVSKTTLHQYFPEQTRGSWEWFWK